MNLKQVVVNGQKLNVSGGSGGSTQSESLPIGSVIMWAGTLETIPTGWHLCDGEDGTIDLRGMFALGAGGTYNLGDEGGSEMVVLTIDQMPSHRHSVRMSTGSGSGSMTMLQYTTGSQTTSASNPIGISGNDEPHPNMPPYKALYYIQKIS